MKTHFDNPFSSPALAVQAQPPSRVLRMVSLSLCGMTALALLFACFARMDIVVTAAQPILTLVPANTPLELEAQVLNRDIGHVRVGQRVINKVETYDFTRYGYIEGEVQWVGTDAVQDQKLGLIYPVRIKLTRTDTPNTVNGRRGVVTAGMNVTADIRTDERRLIEYLLAPMLRYKQEALRER